MFRVQGFCFEFRTAGLSAWSSGLKVRGLALALPWLQLTLTPQPSHERGKALRTKWTPKVCKIIAFTAPQAAL